MAASASPTGIVFGIVLLGVFAGCGGDPLPPSATAVTFDPTAIGGDARTVQAAIEDLYRRQALLEVPPKEPLGQADAGVEVQTLQLRISELEKTTMSADRVGYDPRQTTLSGKTVQEALTELEARVARLEQQQQGSGAPGAGLFELRDKNGRLIQQGSPNGPPNGQGGPNGPGKGPTPGGQGGPHPPNGQGGPPQNGPQNGQGGPNPPNGR